MTPFRPFRAIAAPIDPANVDTDQLAPLHRIDKLSRVRPNYADSLFFDQRFDSAGAERPEFILNMPKFRHAEILVVAENFGCGSSREQAVWALADFGIRALIGPSFGDIFHQNCGQNGIAAIRLEAWVCNDLRAVLKASPGSEIGINLTEQIIELCDGQLVSFEFDAFRKACLLRGTDEIGLTGDFSCDIARYERQRDVESPWAGPITASAHSSPQAADEQG